MDTDRIRILVVDDDVDTANSTAEVLTLWGYDATACTSGLTGLACARVRRPAVVLVDLAMPRMDGFRFAGTFHGLPGCEAVPLVAVSGYSPQTCGPRAREAGIAHYLLKPADLGQLQALLALVTHCKAVPSELRAGMRRSVREHRSRRQLLLASTVLAGGDSRVTPRISEVIASVQ